MSFSIASSDRPVRVLVFCFLLSLLIGYFVALLQVYEHTGFDVGQIVLKYRGSSNPDLMAYPKPYKEILQSTHAHILSVPIVYFLLSFIFIGTKLSSRHKVTAIVVLFSGFIVEYLSLWGLRYLSSSFVYLAFMGSGFSGLVYLWMVGRSSFECFRK